MTMTAASLVDRADDGVVADPADPAERPRRRAFSAEYKKRILDEYEALPSGGGHRGALLRREGLYSSQVTDWRRAADRAVTAALETHRSGGPTPKQSAEQAEIDRLRARNARLEAELERTRLALEITGKAHALLEKLSESAATDPKSTR
jgi:transposase-like protein